MSFSAMELGRFVPFVIIVLTSTYTTPPCSGFELVVTHTNDVHARFEEADKYGGQCDAKEKQDGACYGGVARRMTKLKELRTQYPENLLLLDAGDEFQGTLWFYVYSGKAAVHFMNWLGYDVMAVGNHEFDNGVDGLVDFLDNASFPVLSANIDSGSDVRLVGKISPSHTFTVNGEAVGVIGYTSTDTPTLSQTESLTFSSEVEALQKQVDILTASGVNKIIALGHSGIKVDRDIARRVQGIDLVIGGHTNTFLYTGEKPSSEDPEGDYPTAVDQVGGNTALVITDYAFGKYLGFLKVTFDAEGKVEKWSGNPILLDSTVPEDPDTLAEVTRWRKPIDNQAKQTIGRSHVFLDGISKSCRLRECNLGNLITDAMVQQNIRHSDETHWTNVSIAIMNSGGIRAPIDQGIISVQDVLTVMPFRNTIDIIEIKGEHLVQVFERSVSKYDEEQLDGAFLQVSGVRVWYDLKKPVGTRVVKLEVRCSDCRVPQYGDVKMDQVYQVLLPFFMANGGDGFDVIPQKLIKHHIIGDLDTDVLLEYITRYSPITHGLEGRIQFTDPSACTSPARVITLSRALLGYAYITAIAIHHLSRFM